MKIFAFTDAEGVCPFAIDTMDIRIDTTLCKDNTIGIRPLEINTAYEVVLFPNPSKGNFSIEIKIGGLHTLKLYSAEGLLLYEQNVSGFELKSINQKLSKGMYVIMIQDANGYSIAKKIAVE